MDDLSLLTLQTLFSQDVAKLLQYAESKGYSVTLGEAYRPPQTAQYYASTHQGIANSNHTKRLAIDVNLFRGTIFLTEKEDYAPLGEWWKSLTTDGVVHAWGGDFASPDADHFSFEYEGIR